MYDNPCDHLNIDAMCRNKTHHHIISIREIDILFPHKEGVNYCGNAGQLCLVMLTSNKYANASIWKGPERFKGTLIY